MNALLLLALVTLALAVPSSVASNPTKMNVTPRGYDLSPKSDTGRYAPETTNFQITYHFDVNVPGGTACSGNIVLTLSPPPANDAYAATFAGNVLTRPFDTNGDGQGDVASTLGGVSPGWDATLNVEFTRRAAAFQSYEFTVGAQASLVGNGCTADPSEVVTNSAPVKADYMPRTQYEPRSYLTKTGQNGLVTFPIKATNTGNGPSRISVEATEKTKGLEALTPPVDVLLDSSTSSPGTSHDSEVLLVSARTPHANGYTNTLHTIQVLLHTRADAPPGTKGAPEDTTALTLSVQVQGAYVPGFDAPLLVGALAGGAGLLGRSRRSR